MEQLGIQPFQLVTQVFNFLVMVFLLSKFLYKPILKVLEERKKKIAEGLAYSQKMKEEAEKSEKKRQEVINQAKEEARKIVEDGKKAGKKLEEEIIGKALTEANTILGKARQDLEREKLEMERDLRTKTVEIAQSWVEAVLGKVLGEKAQKTLINQKIEDLEKSSK